MFGSYDGWFPKFPIIRDKLPNPQYLAAGGHCRLQLCRSERAAVRDQSLWGPWPMQSAIGSDFDYQVSYVSRYTSVHFTPDPIGDLVFNGVASNVSQSSLVNGLQGDGSYRLNDGHTIRMGFFASY